MLGQAGDEESGQKVPNLAASIAFYRDRLGLELAHVTALRRAALWRGRGASTPSIALGSRRTQTGAACVDAPRGPGIVRHHPAIQVI